MPLNPRWDRAVLKLLALTKQAKLEWRIDYGLKAKREHVVGHVYTTTLESKTIAVYEHQYQHWTDDDAFEWQHDVVVEFVDESGVSEWIWPDCASRFELLDTIRYQDAGAEGFLKKLIGPEDDF